MKGFVISWFYPPINSSEGLVTFKLLNRSKVTHDVFTQKDNNLWSYNTNEKSLTNPAINTIFGDSSSLENWVASCVKYFDEHHHEYDFIMSRSMPPESHMAAMAIKEKYPHIRWMASFGDPIYNSPYSKIAAPQFDPGPNTERFLSPRYVASATKKAAKKGLWTYQTRGDRRNEKESLALESAVFKNANAIIFNNPYQQEFMLEIHQPDTSVSTVVLPHSYESSLYPKKESKSRDDKLIISHIGHLDRIRTPINVLKALERVKTKRPELYSLIELNFYGTLDDLSKIYIIDTALHDSVHLHKPVSYLESLSVMSNSDWCLLVDANIATKVSKNVYFAAKLADYLGAGTPILATSMIEGASADIVRETGNIVTSHSVDEIYTYLVMIAEGKISAEDHNDARKKYSASDVAKTYDALIKSQIKPARSK